MFQFLGTQAEYPYHFQLAVAIKISENAHFCLSDLQLARRNTLCMEDPAHKLQDLLAFVSRWLLPVSGMRVNAGRGSRQSKLRFDQRKALRQRRAGALRLATNANWLSDPKTAMPFSPEKYWVFRTAREVKLLEFGDFLIAQLLVDCAVL